MSEIKPPIEKEIDLTLKKVPRIGDNALIRGIFFGYHLKYLLKSPRESAPGAFTTGRGKLIKLAVSFYQLKIYLTSFSFLV